MFLYKYSVNVKVDFIAITSIITRKAKRENISDTLIKYESNNKSIVAHNKS